MLIGYRITEKLRRSESMRQLLKDHVENICVPVTAGNRSHQRLLECGLVRAGWPGEVRPRITVITALGRAALDTLYRRQAKNPGQGPEKACSDMGLSV